MVLKIISKQNFRFFNFTAKKILKCNFCNVVSTQEASNNYKYLLILDFEATCDSPQLQTQEIIEFPCLKVNIDNCKEEGRFHQYVRPVINPTLSHFCVRLTGILQEMVDESKTFPEVFQMYQKWMEEEGLTVENSLYVTSGDWDLGYMIRRQCTLDNLEVPSHMTEWSDIKKLFGLNSDRFYNNLSGIMSYYGLQFQGRQHSGIDDCLNILQVVKKMTSKGIKFKPTSTVVNDKIHSLSSRMREPVIENKLNRPSRIVKPFIRKK